MQDFKHENLRGGGRLNSQKNIDSNGNLVEKRSSFNIQLFAEKEGAKKAKTKRFSLFITLILVIVLSVVSIPVVAIISKNNAIAITSSDTSTAMPVIGEIFQNNSFNNANMKKFMTYISSNREVSGLSSSATATDIRNYTYGGKESGKAVVVTLGGLEWQVVYLTKDTEGNNVATLLLNDTTDNAKWQTWNGFDDDDVGNTPSNMYGTSYMRAVVLNNGGYYVTNNTGNNKTTVVKKTTVAENKYAPFTVDSFGLTSYIVTPSKIQYQLESQGFVDDSYLLNNEALNVGTNYPGYDYLGKTGYKNWQNDTIWLPSLSEEGWDDSNQGIWKLSISERAISSLNYSCLRSARYDRSYLVCYVHHSGTSSSFVFADATLVVRPALHLNLTKAVPIWESTITTKSTSGGTVSGGGEFDLDVEVTITATPSIGYKFVGWKKDSESGYCSTDVSYTFNVTSSATYTAYFEKIKYTLTVIASGAGTVTGGGVYEYGSTPTITATSFQGYIFAGWKVSGNNSYISTSASYTLSAITSDMTYTAEFILNAGAIVCADIGGEARIVGNRIQEGVESDTVTFVAVPYAGYRFKGWAYVIDQTTILSTELSHKFSKTEANGKIIIALFETINTNNINSETNNSTDFWE